MNLLLKRTVLLLMLIFSVLGIEFGFAMEDNTEVIKKPQCKARRARESGRLNIDTTAKNYGLTKPCVSFLSFYIAKNTSLRSVDGKIKVLDLKANMLLERSFHVDLQRKDNGMYQSNYPVEGVNGYSCQNLKLNINSLVCLGQTGYSIDCPKIWLKSSTVFKDLLIDDKNLDVCFDD